MKTLLLSPRVAFAFTVADSFNKIFTVLVVFGFFAGGIKLFSAFGERQAEERKWGIIGGIGMAVAFPIIYGVMALAGFTPRVSNDAAL